MTSETLRDHFSAAALTGFASQLRSNYGSVLTLTAKQCYELADAMLRERERTSVGVAGMDPVADRKSAATPGACASPCSQPFDSAPITHDAAPAARADSPDERPPHAVSAGGTPSAASRDGGTGDTQEIAAFRRFVGEVMNWISEATGFLHDDVLRTDDARDIITDACSRCWDAFDRIAPTDHGASPEARASGESVVPQPTPRGDSDRTDKAAPRPSEGTGDTPATHATPPQGSEPREGTEPEAWAVCTPNDGNWSPCFFHEPHAQRCANAIFGSKNIVPLYRQPPCQGVSRKNWTLTDAEAETLRELRDEAAQYADEIGLCASEVKVRQRIIDGLLERMGGGR
jgi:hypothetical protein